MKYVTFITCLYLIIVSILSAFLANAVLFLAALIAMPMFIQSLPWGLAADQFDDEQDGPNNPADDYQDTALGFTSKKKLNAQAIMKPR